MAGVSEVVALAMRCAGCPNRRSLGFKRSVHPGNGVCSCRSLVTTKPKTGRHGARGTGWQNKCPGAACGLPGPASSLCRGGCRPFSLYPLALRMCNRELRHWRGRSSCMAMPVSCSPSAPRQAPWSICVISTVFYLIVQRHLPTTIVMPFCTDPIGSPPDPCSITHR